MALISFLKCLLAARLGGVARMKASVVGVALPFVVLSAGVAGARMRIARSLLPALRRAARWAFIRNSRWLLTTTGLIGHLVNVSP